jgi:hypothetical protein
MTREIEVSSGLVALVDDEDYDKLVGRRWYKHTNNGRCNYAQADISWRPHKRVWMHRLVMDAPQGLEVDHINGNGLDNRRDNLRLCTRSQNACNKAKSHNRGLTSRHKGVSTGRWGKNWQANITIQSRKIYLGTYDTEMDAVLAYNRAALELHGPFSRANEV